jgi:glycosyltransferase involved in cell wall biosynthesis
MKQKISIIIPAFNEEEAVVSVIKDVRENLVDTRHEYEIIVVDDASSDNTAIIAEQEGVRVIAHSKNRGYGASLKTGIGNSDGEFIAIIDADGSYKGKDLLRLIEKIDDSDMVVGARIKKSVNDDPLRKIVKFFLNLFASYLVEVKIPDLNSGFRIIRRDKIRKFLKILPDGFSFTTTITIAFLDSGLSVSFVPVDYEKRRLGKSKIRPIYDTLNFIQLIIRTVLYFNPLRVFVPVSIFLFLSSIAVFLYSKLFLDKILDITTIVLFATSIQMLAIGMIADLIIRRAE